MGVKVTDNTTFGRFSREWTEVCEQLKPHFYKNGKQIKTMTIRPNSHGMIIVSKEDKKK